jgi:hypothetical protein
VWDAEYDASKSFVISAVAILCAMGEPGVTAAGAHPGNPTRRGDLSNSLTFIRALSLCAKKFASWCEEEIQ